MKFVCKDCNFHFESDAKLEKVICPYCGKKTVIKELSAEELLEE
jgi:DNA-directed RNA polymerase subunit RPC12/RpoP